MAASTRDTKSKPLTVSEKLNVMYEELAIPVRKVTDKMLRWSVIGENVL